MHDSGKIRVLFVGDSSHLFSRFQKHLERNGCECEFAECERVVCEMLGQRQFDLVLGLHPNRRTGSPRLAVLLTGTATTLFYGLRVEVGCWWVPLLRLGEECFGAPALRPSEFTSELDQVLKEIKAGATWRGNLVQTT
jgi:hypothetical protein